MIDWNLSTFLSLSLPFFSHSLFLCSLSTKEIESWLQLHALSLSVLFYFIISDNIFRLKYVWTEFKLNAIIQCTFSVSKSHQTHQFHANRVEMRLQYITRINGKNSFWWKCTLIQILCAFEIDNLQNICIENHEGTHFFIFLLWKSTFLITECFYKRFTRFVVFFFCHGTKGIDNQSHQEAID